MSLKSSSVAITLKNVQKTFDDGTLALKPLDLDIDAGEILVLLGPSGCGKTTTLRLIAGLEFADEGSQIMFGNQDVTKLPIESRRVGMVFQSYALFPNMNVTENIEYGLRVRGESKEVRQPKVAEMLEMFDLTPYANRGIDQLSGGQRQRVALARAIITQPQVLLLDEPLSALDAQLKKRLRTDINALLKRLGITAIYVTHDQEEAMVMGDRIAVLEHGEIAQIGSAEDIYLAPKSKFVADFIGQMNYLIGVRSGDALDLGESAVMPLSSDLLHGVETGKAVTAMVRPEDIEIFPAGQQGVPGKVISSVFLGDRTRVMAEVGEEQELVCVDCFAREEYIDQQEIVLMFNPQRVVLLKGQ